MYTKFSKMSSTVLGLMFGSGTVFWGWAQGFGLAGYMVDQGNWVGGRV